MDCCSFKQNNNATNSGMCEGLIAMKKEDLCHVDPACPAFKTSVFYWKLDDAHVLYYKPIWSSNVLVDSRGTLGVNTLSSYYPNSMSF